jgi:hypothetical protein
MPAEKESLAEKLNRFVKLFGSDVLETDKLLLYCKLCECSVGSRQKSQVDAHIATAMHKKAVMKVGNHDAKDGSNEGEPRAKQMMLTSFIATQSAAQKRQAHNEKLCNMMVKADIPFEKLNSPYFRSYLEEETKHHIPDASTLRKYYVNVNYEQVIRNIRQQIGEYNVFVQLDETADKAGRCVTNVLVGALTSNEFKPPFLFNCAVLDRVNQNTVGQLFDETMHLLWPGGIRYERVVLLVTDAARYMKAFGRNQREGSYPKLVHITCCAHGLHNVAEKIRSEFPLVDEVIYTVKSVFLKAPNRRETFRTIAGNLPLPPEPVLTRWGTWLAAANYYNENLAVIQRVVAELDDDAECIRRAKVALNSNELKNQLAFLSGNYGFLPATIGRLEERGMSLEQSVSLFEEAGTRIRAVQGVAAGRISQKLQQVTDANAGFAVIRYICSVLRNEQAAPPDRMPDFEPAVLSSFKFAPITSVDVERSFSRYKAVLRENRMSFTFENLRRYFVVHCYDSS